MKVSKKVVGVEYAIRDIVTEARKLQKQGKRVTYLNIGDPVQFGFQPPDNVKEAMIKAIRNGENYYAQSEGLPELREEIAKKEQVQERILQATELRRENTQDDAGNHPSQKLEKRTLFTKSGGGEEEYPAHDEMGQAAGAHHHRAGVFDEAVIGLKDVLFDNVDGHGQGEKEKGNEHRPAELPHRPARAGQPPILGCCGNSHNISPTLPGPSGC